MTPTDPLQPQPPVAGEPRPAANPEPAPAAPAAPVGTVPVPVPPAPAASASKLKPGVVIAAIVAVIAIGGGLVAFLASKGGGDDPGQFTTEVAADDEPFVPDDLPVLDPTDGPIVSDNVEPPPPPDPEPVVTTTAPAPPTTEPAAPPAPSDGSAISVSGVVSVVPSPGWSQSSTDTGFLGLTHESGAASLYLSVYDASIGGTVATAASNYVDSQVAPYIAELEVTTPTARPPASAAVVDNGDFMYRGVLATQNGNLPVEGYIAIFVLNTGDVVVYEEMWATDSYDVVDADLQPMLDSVIASMP